MFNQILSGQFDKVKYYKFYIECTMKEMDIDYLYDTMGKGDIVRIVMQQKAELIKIRVTAFLTHMDAR